MRHYYYSALVNANFKFKTLKNCSLSTQSKRSCGSSFEWVFDKRILVCHKDWNSHIKNKKHIFSLLMVGFNRTMVQNQNKL